MCVRFEEPKVSKNSCARSHANKNPSLTGTTTFTTMHLHLYKWLAFALCIADRFRLRMLASFASLVLALHFVASDGKGSLGGLAGRLCIYVCTFKHPFCEM
jgi:hypothetical protein